MIDALLPQPNIKNILFRPQETLIRNLRHSKIYRNSKKVTVRLNHGFKGAVIKLKIGGKTYKKKLTSNTTKVKFKIKKPKYIRRICTLALLG